MRDDTELDQDLGRLARASLDRRAADVDVDTDSSHRRRASPINSQPHLIVLGETKPAGWPSLRQSYSSSPE